MKQVLATMTWTTLLQVFAGTAFLAVLYVLLEWLFRISSADPELSPALDAVFFLAVTMMLVWLSLWAFARVRMQTLEGVRDLLTQAGIAMCMLDRRGRILWYNPALARLFGFAEHSRLGQPFQAALAAFESGELRLKLENVLSCVSAGRSCRDEVDVRFADGRRLSVFYALSPVFGPRGQSLGALVIVLDITERKQMAEELRASRDNLQALLDAIPAAVVVVEAATGRPQLWNRATERLIGPPCALQVSRGETCRFISPFVRRAFDAQGKELAPEEMALYQTLRTHEPVNEQHYVIEFTDGRRLDIAESTAFLETAEGGRGVLIFQDISGIERLHRELVAERIATEQLQAVLATIATLNHEINNPLTGILGAADLILIQPGLNPTAERYAEKIVELARRIGDDLRQLSVLTRFERRTEKGFEPFLEVKRNVRQ